MADAMQAKAAGMGKNPIAESGDDLSWKLLADALPTAIYTTDAAGRITFYNDAAATLWGYRPEFGKSWSGSWKLYRSDGTPLPHDECPLALTLKTGKPVRGVETLVERPDGTRVHFMPYPTLLHDDAGRIVGAVNMLVDLTERVRADQVTQRLVAIVESSDDAIVSKDLLGVVSSWNDGAQRLFGYRAEEMVGNSITMLIPADSQDEETKILQRIRRGERIHHYETVRRRKDGSLVDISLTVSPIRDSAGKIVGASKIARDITEYKEAEARRTLLTRELHHRTKNIFAIVQAVVSRSFIGKTTVEEAQKAVLERLHALGRAHILLVDGGWHGTDLAELARFELRPFGDRVEMHGPTLMMSPQAAQNFALAMHELASNSARYGALSSASGRVAIGWSVEGPESTGEFTFHWRESDGPLVEPPIRRGFGCTVLEQVLAEYAKSPPKLHFARTGLTYEVRGPLEGIVPPTPYVEKIRTI